jgi:hypothetical protein
MPSHLGDGSSRVTNVIEVIDEDAEVLLLGIKWLNQILARMISLELKDEWIEWERGWEELFAKEWSAISKLGVGKCPKEVRESFYTPSHRSYH